MLLDSAFQPSIFLSSPLLPLGPALGELARQLLAVADVALGTVGCAAVRAQLCSNAVPLHTRSGYLTCAEFKRRIIDLRMAADSRYRGNLFGAMHYAGQDAGAQ